MTKYRQTITFEYDSEYEDKRYFAEGHRIRAGWDTQPDSEYQFKIVEAQDSVRVKPTYDKGWLESHSGGRFTVGDQGRVHAWRAHAGMVFITSDRSAEIGTWTEKNFLMQLNRDSGTTWKVI